MPQLHLLTPSLPFNELKDGFGHPLASLISGVSAEIEPRKLIWYTSTAPPPSHDTTLPIELVTGEATPPERDLVTMADHFVRHNLWTVFHFRPETPRRDAGNGWKAFVEMNQEIAGKVASRFMPRDIVWVHGLHLALTPEILRELLPNAKIGYFLQTPFPSRELFRTLPWKEVFLEGMLGADLIGFQTHEDLRNFVDATEHSIGLQFIGRRFQHSGRNGMVGVFPTGVNSAAIASECESEPVKTETRRIRAELGPEQLILCVDHMDEGSQGITRRLLAFEKLLCNEPSLSGKVQLLQILNSDTEGEHPLGLDHQRIHQLVVTMNSRFGFLGWTPVKFFQRKLDRVQLLGLYRAADVFAVTSIREGLNLSSKEFVAARDDNQGTLLLSEFCGTLSELAESITVNPYDTDCLSDAFKHALGLSQEEQWSRMIALRKRVFQHDARHWVRSFLNTLVSVPPSPVANRRLNRETLAQLVNFPKLIVFLDDDACFLPYSLPSGIARPNFEFMEQLKALSRLPEVQVVVKSGRTRAFLERWFGELPVHLLAEHGAWRRAAGSADWESDQDAGAPWLSKALTICDRYVSQTPGSSLEQKESSLCWRFNLVNRDWGMQRANSLIRDLEFLLDEEMVQVTLGEGYVELKPLMQGESNDTAPFLEGLAGSKYVLAVGSGPEAENLFRALSPWAVTIGLGHRETSAHFRMKDRWQLLSFFKVLVEARSQKAVPETLPTPASLERVDIPA